METEEWKMVWKTHDLEGYHLTWTSNSMKSTLNLAASLNEHKVFSLIAFDLLSQERMKEAMNMSLEILD